MPDLPASILVLIATRLGTCDATRLGVCGRLYVAAMGFPRCGMQNSNENAPQSP